MPAKKLVLEAHQEDEDALRANDVDKVEKPVDEAESDRSNSWNNSDKEEYVIVKLSDVRKEVQCPICLGIIRKTRTVMECLHRFCRACIDKSMRLGNNECPACRTHCASRRSLRDDPNYDALIAALYPDIDKYEEEELALREDELNHSKQVQASIAQTFQRRTEASGKKRNAKETTAAFVKSSQGNHGASHVRRRNARNAGELQVPNDDEDMNDNDEGKGSSSDDEQTETKPKRCKREGETQLPQHSASTDADLDGEANIPQVDREIITSSGTLSWGKNGHRSNSRVSSGKNSTSSSPTKGTPTKDTPTQGTPTEGTPTKDTPTQGTPTEGTPTKDTPTKGSRISGLVDLLRSSEDNDEKLGISVMVVSLDEQIIPSLQEPYLECKPTLSISSLSKHIALNTALQADEVELCLIEEPGEAQVSIIRGERTFDPSKDTLRVLAEQETLAELKSDNLIRGFLLLAYRRKLQNSPTVHLS